MTTPSSSDPQPKWRWESVDPNRTGASGDLSKTFKNEPVKAPGVLAVDAPAPEAALLVREVIQNSWDAALESREASVDLELPPFEVCFEVKSLTGEERSGLVEHLGLQELSKRRQPSRIAAFSACPTTTA